MSTSSTPHSVRTIGILGGGQLGRMLCDAATRLGFKTHVYSPEKEGPAFSVCSQYTQGAFEDREALAEFARAVDVVTFEFENIPVDVLDVVPQGTPIHPLPNVLWVCQNRGREKEFLSQNGFPIAPYLAVLRESDLADTKPFRFPAVLKTAGFGYDGKGQTKVHSMAEARAAFAAAKGQPMVLEQWIEYSAEGSVIVARNTQGEKSTWSLFENQHAHHILDVTLWPATLSGETAEKAKRIAFEIADRLQVVGLIAVEFFITRSGEVLVNELAPRPHNSGHITMNASKTSQFEQHVRAITGMPMGSTECSKPGAMANLLGDLWLAVDGEPNWKRCQRPDAFLHLYGKTEARRGRKMGHLNVLGQNAKGAAELARSLRDQILIKV